MRGPIVMVGAAAAVSALAVTAVGGVAAADPLDLPTLLPSISTTPLPTLTTSTPLPLPTSTSAPLPLPSTTLTGGSGGGGGGGTGGSGGSGSAAGPSGTATSRPGSPASTVKPMVAGRPDAVRDLKDDEASPAMRRANAEFLKADEAILAVTRAQAQLLALKIAAQRLAADYRAFGADIAGTRAQAADLHRRHDASYRTLVRSARAAYQSGGAAGGLALVGFGGAATGASSTELARIVDRLDTSATHAELRVGWLTTRQAEVKADFLELSSRYRAAARTLADANAQLQTLAAQRARALDAVRAARGSDLALHRTRLAESGRLGAQIRAAVAALARAGRTVTGTGDFARPGTGSITSPYGMRYHPILHYRKLHTGTDFGRADGTAYAADNGRVLFTMVSRAYGNLTVIDHGVVDGEHVTTLYAHQARFLVREGQVVRKGQPIGVIGSTGYATGPHLHFEVRLDGAVTDPMAWL